MRTKTIRRWREDRHLTQQKLAEAARVHRTTVAFAETGRVPSDDVKKRIARALQVQIDAIAWGVREFWLA